MYVLTQQDGYPAFVDHVTRILNRCFAQHGPMPDDCLVWSGAKAGRDAKKGGGYGVIRIDGVKWAVHRAIWWFTRGPIPAGLVVDHICRNRACCNIRHLRLKTNAENILLGNAPSAIAARKTHCPQNHPYSGDNLIVEKNGQRRCRTCRRDQQRRRAA